jgi:MFS transporter, OPA family, sugar phosphate sensor protein UhpC
VSADETPLDPKLRAWRYRIFASTWLCYAGLYFCRKPFYVAKADLGEALGWDASFLGLLGTVYLVTYTLGQFIAGVAGSVWGPRIVLMIGMGGSVVANLVFGWTDSALTFAAFMGLNGFAQAVGWSNTVGNMARWFRRGERGRVMGIWATCYQVGGVLGAGLAAFVLGVAGYQHSFVVGSAVLLGVMWFFAFNQRNQPEDVGLSIAEGEQEGDQKGGVQGSLFAAGDTWAERFSNLGWDQKVIKTILLVGVFYFFVKFIRYALWSWVPFLLSRNYGLEGDDAGYMSTIFDLLGIAGVIAAGWISDRMAGSRRTGVSLLFLIGMVAACALLYSWGQNSLVAFGVCLGGVGFFLYGPDALMTGAGAQDIGNERGAVLSAAVINGMGSVGAVTQELVIGHMYDSQGGDTGPIFGLLVGSAIGAALCLWLVRLLKLSDV